MTRSPSHPPGAALSHRDRLGAEALAALYVVANLVVAQHSSGHYLFFPGLAALSYEVFVRPWGNWASQPVWLVATPTVGAVMGTYVTRTLPYGVAAILLILVGCLSVLAITRSHITPTIAAGALPLVLGTTSWCYPVSVGLGLLVLVFVFLTWRRYCRHRYAPPYPRGSHGSHDRSSTPNNTNWKIVFVLFVTVATVCAVSTGVRFLLVPPLIVVSYGMLANPGHAKPWTAAVACSTTATCGWLLVSHFGKSAPMAGCIMVIGLVVLRGLDLTLPPVLAIGLLPLVIASPTIGYPLAVTAGFAALAVVVDLYRGDLSGRIAVRIRRRRADDHPSMRSSQ